MFSRTHSSAATWSSSPTFAMPSSRYRNPSAPGTPVDHDADDAVAGEATAVVRRRRAELEHAALDPHHHRQPRRPRVGRPDVEVQALVGGRGALDLREGRIDLGPVLRSPRCGAAGRRRRHLGGSGPSSVASRTPLHGSTGWGGRSRFAPNGGAAYGMPRYTYPSSMTRPRTSPASVWTTSAIRTTVHAARHVPQGRRSLTPQRRPVNGEHARAARATPRLDQTRRRDSNPRRTRRSQCPGPPGSSRCGDVTVSLSSEASPPFGGHDYSSSASSLGSSNSRVASSSTFTSLKVSTRTDFTKRSAR